MKEQPGKADRISTYLIGFSAAVFVLLYLVLSFRNRPSYDDVYFISLAKSNGLQGYVEVLYSAMAGRWSAWAYSYFVFSSYSFESTSFLIFLYYLITLLILIYSLQQIVLIGIEKMFGIKLNSLNALIYGIVLLTSFYFFTFQIIETWWYICSSIHYLQGIAFFLLGFSMLIRETKSWWHYLTIAFSFAYTGACFELYPVIIDCLFVLIFVLYLGQHAGKKINWKTSFLEGLLVAFVVMNVAAFFVYIAPANELRRAYYETNREQFYHPIDFASILNIFNDKKYIFALLISSLWFLIGMKVKEMETFEIKRLFVKKVLGLSLFTLCASVLILFLFSYFVTFSIMAPARSWAFTGLMLAVCICLVFFIAGCKLSLKPITSTMIKLILPGIVFIGMTFVFYKQEKLTRVYSEKYDQLIKELMEAKRTNLEGTFYYERLPDAGMLMQLDLINESYNSAPLKNILGIDFEIKEKQ